MEKLSSWEEYFLSDQTHMLFVKCLRKAIHFEIFAFTQCSLINLVLGVVAYYNLNTI